jgi:hypothetical protein
MKTNHLWIFITVFLVSSTAHAMDEISYKNTKFGITEATFIQKFSTENFLCKTAVSGVGRQCESSRSTYADEPANNTMAFFLNDELIAVSIFFSGKKESLSKNLQYSLLIQALEGKYGAKRKIEEKKEKGFYVETHKWNDSLGHQISFIFTDSKSAGSFASIHIESENGTKLFNKESAKRSNQIQAVKSKDM